MAVADHPRLCTLSNNIQVLRIGKPSTVAAMLPVSEFGDDVDVVMLTTNGLIKRTKLSQFSKITARGVCCMKLKVRLVSLGRSQ